MRAAQTFLGNEMAQSLHSCTPKPTQKIYIYSSRCCMRVCVRASHVEGGRGGTEHLPVDLHDRAIVRFG